MSGYMKMVMLGESPSGHLQGQDSLQGQNGPGRGQGGSWQGKNTRQRRKDVHPVSGNRFYVKLAWTGIRNNRRFYLPYILTCSAMVAIYYIISFLTTNPLFDQMIGGTIMRGLLILGCGVICVFSVIFLFYTNSFLIKRRKKEFGLYNILGMGKRSLSWILCWESLIIAVLSMTAGLVLGLLFSKLAELAMTNILLLESNYAFYVSPEAIVDTAKTFALIFLLLLGNMLYQVWKSNPMELLHSEQTGEKPPKVNWLFALAGIVILAGAYYLAVSIKDPAAALLLFFVAVIMVIVATYLLFISGSVALCRLLQKNKWYYYKANHFVSVSSMGYRMKRNGASLASICILCTMVLVMLMSTGCLYMGMEGSLRERYARNIMFDISAKDLGVSDSEYAEGLRGVVEKSAKDRGETVKNVLDYSFVDFGGYVMGDEVYLDSKEIRFQANTWQMFVFSLEDYNRLAGADETLGADEALCHVSKTHYDYDTVTLGNEAQLKTWNIKKQVGKFVDVGADASQIMPSMFLVVADVEEALAPWLYDMVEEGGQEMLRHWIYGVDIPCGDEKQKAIFNDMLENIGAMNERVMNEDGGLPFVTYVSECVAMERGSFYEIYGGLFFLGIMLGLVFILAAVLMMYYKQLSEGYEDQARFEIMQKVGMTARQIKKSINSQVLTVFFLPLLVAVLHLAFAFPLVYKMLLLLGFSNQNLLVLVTVGCVLVFALFYILVYNVTSRAYYKIVSPASSSGRSSR